MLRRSLAILIVAASWSCAADDTEPEPDGLEWGASYVHTAAIGRQALEDSLVTTDNSYARLRLNNYGPGKPWSDFEVVDRPVRPITSLDLGEIENAWALTDGDFEPLGPLDDWSHQGVIDYGRRAFQSYPLGADSAFGAALDNDDEPDNFGLWRHDSRIGGVVRVRLSDDSEAYAPTCSTCHASVDDGALLPGRPNAEFDYSALALHAASGSQTYPASQWGRGSVDVTPDGVANPTAMADLRAVRYQTNLHWAATIENSLPALTVRIETLITTSLGSARPPREVAFAIAYYLWNLGDSGVPARGGEGEALFEANCSSCHGADGRAIDAVAVDVVGTDPLVARSPSRGRGDGFYRVPSLWKAGTRGQFLHDGALDSLEELLSADRLDEIPGHVYGTHLSDADKAALLDFVRRIGAE